MAQNDISDCSGQLLYASLFNTQIDKDNMSLLDNIVIDESDNIIDITLKAREITYNEFRLLVYPTTTGSLQMNKINTTYLQFDQWEIETDDGTHPFIYYDFIISAIEQKLGVNKNSHNYYGWDNEYGSYNEIVPSFKASKYLVSNGQFLEFINDNPVVRNTRR